MTRVFLHVGLAKTGTTTIQTALEESRAACARHGLHLAGGRHRASRMAAYDLVGRRIEGDRVDPVAGAFRRLVADIDTCGAPRAVVSEELLALAQSRHVRRVGEALRRHELEVVVGVRDLGRTVLSAWQQEIVNGQSFRWREYADAVRDPEQGRVRAGVAFWLRHDVLRVLDTWGRLVPPDRVHLVVAPPRSAPEHVLLDRFAEAVGLPTGVLRAGGPPRNAALGVAELELVRRLNARLTALPRRQYLHVVERGIRPGLQREGSRRLVLPQEDAGWVAARSAQVIEGLRSRGHQVHGDLEELRSDPGTAAGAPSEASEQPLLEASTEELLEVAEEALVSLATVHGRLFGRYRRAFGDRGEEDAGPLERLASSARATGFKTRLAVLERADHNKVLAWAARTRLRRR